MPDVSPRPMLKGQILNQYRQTYIYHYCAKQGLGP